MYVNDNMINDLCFLIKSHIYHSFVIFQLSITNYFVIVGLIVKLNENVEFNNINNVNLFYFMNS